MILIFIKIKVKELVKLESGIYGDIVMEDFIDSYKNLTYKGWINFFKCSKSKYLNNFIFIRNNGYEMDY